MRKIRFNILFFLLIVSIVSPSVAQISRSGSITSFVDSIITTIPDATPSGLYQVPNSTDKAHWDSIVERMLEGDFAGAHTEAQSIDYNVLQFSDTTNSTTYYLLAKKSSGSNYWGTFIVDPDPLRSRLFIQIPHPLFDTNSGNQGIVVFKNSAARAFIMAGTHRCNSAVLSSCDGTTTVCAGSSQAFRISDQAHVVDGPFQIATEVFKRSVPNLIVIQLHGFVKDPGYPDVILGNGTQSTPGTDWLTAFKNTLAALDGTLQFKIAHIDTAWTTLTGTTNTQGRLINNSSNPCGDAAAAPTGRFLHIEQAYTGLRDNAISYAKVASAIANTFPPDKEIVSAATGNWEQTSTWVGSVVPNDTTHVVIASGHTVTVTTASAEGKSLSFSDNTSSIAFAAAANLSLSGDLTLATTTHNAFSAWASDAALTFTGTDDQVLSGWNTDSSSFSSTLMKVVIDKSSGSVMTSGSDMNLNVGTSLEIVSGNFILTAGDDLEGRNLAGNSSSAPSITVCADGSFIIAGDSSYIRSGTADTNAVGRLQNYGNVQMNGTDLFQGYNISDIENESGGTIEVFSGWKSSRLVRTDTLLIKNGSVFETSTTTNIVSGLGRTVLNAGGTYRIFGSSVNFSSSFTNNGTVEFASSSAQTVSDRSYKKLILSGSGTKSWNLSEARTADTLMISGSASLNFSSTNPVVLGVNTLLTMNGGNITTNNDTLILGQSASAIGTMSRISGMIIGNFKRWMPASVTAGMMFPIGTLSQYRPASISYTLAPSVGGTVSAAFISSAPGTDGLPLDDAGFSLMNIGSEGYWKFETAYGLTGGTFSMELMPNNYSGISDVSTLRIVQRSPSGNWSIQGTHIAGSGTTASPIVKRSGLTQLMEFGIASGVDNPLPVELTSFTAVHKRGTVELKWKTATEVNNHGFEVERKMVSGFTSQVSDVPSSIVKPETSIEQWHRIAFVDGAGNSNAAHEYSYNDRVQSAGKYAFRLKQIDRNGSSVFSHAVEVDVAVIPNELKLEQNFPNPFNPSTTLTFTVPEQGNIQLTIYNTLGEEVAVLFQGQAEPGILYQRQFTASTLSSGIYFARLSFGKSSIIRKMTLIR